MRPTFARRPAVSRATYRVLGAWADDELHYWRHGYAGSRDFREAFARINDGTASIYVVDIVAGKATVRDKAPHLALDDNHRRQGAIRSRHYAEYLEDSLAFVRSRLSTTLAIDVHDLPFTDVDAPLFTFQKPAGSRSILLPDIDFMQQDWYRNTYAEPEFAAKRSKAVFVGASTGGGQIDRDAVTDARPDRLRLARAFHGSPHMDFTITRAVQCDGPGTADHLAAQPYFASPMPWEEQLAYKFLFSMDGNGATCSRVVNALRSRSVLLKYRSDNLLFYFKGLSPWRHYVPIREIGDVARIIEEEARGDFDARAMIVEANRFAARYLRRASLLVYGALLLDRYAAIVGSGGAAATPTRLTRRLRDFWGQTLIFARAAESHLTESWPRGASRARHRGSYHP